jgi:hypothetical protein
MPTSPRTVEHSNSDIGITARSALITVDAHATGRDQDPAYTLRVEREDGELLVLDRLHTTAPESMAAATSATVGERARRALGGSKGATPGSSSR